MENDALFATLFGQELKKTDRNKIQIAQATLALINDSGIRGLSFEKIGVACGKKKALVRYYFGSIDAILHFLLKFSYLQAQEVTLTMLRKTTPGGNNRILAIANGAFIWARKYPQQLSFTLAVSALGIYQAEVKAMLKEIRLTGHQRIKAILQEDMSLSAPKAVAMAHEIQTVIQGYLFDYAITERFALGTYQKKSLDVIETICRIAAAKTNENASLIENI